MDVFDPVSETLNRTHYTMPPSTSLSRSYYGNVWCKARSSILYWGGHAYRKDPNIKVDMVSEFKPDTQTWAPMVTLTLLSLLSLKTSQGCSIDREFTKHVYLFCEYVGDYRNHSDYEIRSLHGPKYDPLCLFRVFDPICNTIYFRVLIIPLLL